MRLRAFQSYHQILCILKHVEDVEDRSNTPKGCNAMYVEDGKRTYTHIFAHNFLNIQPIFNFLMEIVTGRMGCIPILPINVTFVTESVGVNLYPGILCNLWNLGCVF